MSKHKQRAAIILAAGKSTRMKSARSKVLHNVGGRSLLAWVADLARQAGADKVVCVVGEHNNDVRAAAETLGLDIAVQEPQHGTGHAVLCAKGAMGDFDGDMIVLCADAPLIRAQTLADVFAALDDGADIAVLGFIPDDAGAYGRLVTQDGDLLKIVEAKEASDEELAVNLCNSGIMAGNAAIMFDALSKVTNDNVKGEYYLTDVVEIGRSAGHKIAAVTAADPDEVVGVNSRTDLAIAETSFQRRKRAAIMDNGVTLRDPETTYFCYDTQIESDAEIGANVVFGPNVTIASGAVIHPFCHIEGTQIGENAQIGPFARLRPGTVMGEGSKAGNFVETKKSIIGKGSKINHLSYIGDAEVGEGANIGAGTITCNYDGYNKHKTIIGDGVFVGSNSSLVAPVTLGAGAYLGSGGVITKDVPVDALAVARAVQVNKEGWAKRYRTAQDARKKSKS
ncbi:bifunctional UDP-N-acetylglucosamine diphosphorylase/glucosamine-1-phosphate N-acetyltransferase GlmU [Robiginitomaculum antarcticum]|uniref:bifunctional UDP-N-acetylglucosamine diphosphorylase/glucosamine-1-phosphate N-acetyltransferase GlmU n=1 Tax=Robiginitomaculum antarcticum TaxID=437507 RepID=UPI000372ED7A|nr:bifunctional UDP-N-acetylglucosamine diphosphorylase/glucosamine-1-phosphate N-acetyltransferase GlmU [Robiginitomaculum antarcticum]